MRRRAARPFVFLATLMLVFGTTSVAAAAPARDSVIVVFRERVANPVVLAQQLGRQHGFAPRFVYQHALKGFAATLPSRAVDALSRNPNVAWVEADGPVWLVADQVGATWGLDRIDEKARLPELDGNYTYDFTGAGVTAYIIDTGIYTDHPDFGGRARSGFDAVDGGTADDCHGHGTHVAGTTGGATYGVAKGVSLVAVRVLDCAGSGSWSGIIAGVDWVTGQVTDPATRTPAVANMSLGGSANSSVDAAVRRSIDAGVSYAIAAGNGNFIGIAQDACKYSPARVSEAMTIGATDSTDKKASFSNYGKCVDWFAPGVSITSAWKDGLTKTISGTSMAAPHTAGAAALYLQEIYLAENRVATPLQVRDGLHARTTKAIVSSSKTANNHLLCSLAVCPD